MSQSTPVAGLLRRAVLAGVAPSAVAAWGRVGEPPRTAWAGRARVGIQAWEATPDTRYDLASLTKPLVTATLALMAVGRGALDLESGVGEAVGEDVTSPLAGATIAQLLSHSAGLPAWVPLYAVARDPAQAAQQVLSTELVAEPGAKVVYSCPGFILLGKILERIFDAPLDVSFRKLVAAPLGLESSLGFRPDPDDPALAGGAGAPDPEPGMCAELGLPGHAVPAVGPGRPNDGNARFLGGVAGNSGLFGTARAVFALAGQYLAAGRTELFSPEEIAAATRVVAADGHQVRGLGWQLASTPGCSAGRGLGDNAFGHTGFTGTSAWVDPDLDGVFVLLTNRHHPGYHEVDLHPLRRRFHELAAGELKGR